MNTTNLIRQFSEEPKSVHDFKVKAMVDPKHFDMIYNSGATEILNRLQAFNIKTANEHPTAPPHIIYSIFSEWAQEQRKTLNSYL